MRYLTTTLLATLLSLLPNAVSAFEYAQDNVRTVYQEAPSSFTVSADGTADGTTISCIRFQQINITNSAGIRLQRFEIGSAYWYVSDRGIIWAASDLAALSIYLSRTV
jgi:hypothetical protein